jgi:hypothetical protein
LPWADERDDGATSERALKGLLITGARNHFVKSCSRVADFQG